jgi:hypothetical protein
MRMGGLINEAPFLFYILDHSVRGLWDRSAGTGRCLQSMCTRVRLLLLTASTSTQLAAAPSLIRSSLLLCVYFFFFSDPHFPRPATYVNKKHTCYTSSLTVQSVEAPVQATGHVDR